MHWLFSVLWSGNQSSDYVSTYKPFSPLLVIVISYPLILSSGVVQHYVTQAKRFPETGNLCPPETEFKQLASAKKKTRWLITNQDLFFFSDHMTSSIDQKYTFCLLSESHYVTLMRWETRAKWKLLSKLISIVWSICLKCHSNCCLVFIIQSLKLWNIKLPEAYYIESNLTALRWDLW